MSYAADTAHFTTALDFLRFALTQASQEPLWYGHGTDNAMDEFRMLILRSLNLPFDADERLLQRQLTVSERQLLTQQLEKRILHKIPVPYLTHEAFFCGYAFYVDERVLIPRSPFAELIEQQFQPWVKAEAVTHILELCTGSGCIAITCAHAFPEAKVVATDISEEALAVAKMNVQKHGVQEKVELIQSDIWEKVPRRRYDLIIANPPYVGQDEMQTLPDEYRHEPKLALEAEENGLRIVKQILEEASNYLTPEGVLVVEVGNSEAALVETYPEVPFMWLEFERGGEGVFLLTAEQLQFYFG